MESILVVGCGWLGKAVARDMLDKGHSVLGTCRSEAAANTLNELAIPNITLLIGPETVCHEREKIRPGSIAIIAIPPRARRGGGEEFPEHIHALIQFLKSCQVKDVILISSTSVYPAQNQHVDESCTDLPDSNSGKVMLKTEKVVQQTAGVNSIILRLSGLIGPAREPGRFMAGKTNLAGGDSPINMILQGDVVRLINLLVAKKPWGKIYNGCAPEHPLKKDFYPLMAARQNLAIPEFDSGKPAPYKIVSTEKAIAELDMQYQWADPMSWGA